MFLGGDQALNPYTKPIVLWILSKIMVFLGGTLRYSNEAVDDIYINAQSLIVIQ